jgi:hypothetical protein
LPRRKRSHEKLRLQSVTEPLQIWQGFLIDNSGLAVNRGDRICCPA